MVRITSILFLLFCVTGCFRLFDALDLRGGADHADDGSPSDTGHLDSSTTDGSDPRPDGSAVPDTESDGWWLEDGDFGADGGISEELSVACGGIHTCVLIGRGSVRCWGQGTYGQLGYGNVESIGDDEVPSVVGDVTVGGEVRGLSAGDQHTCAVLSGGGLRCWGRSNSGRLGYGNTDNIGDDEVPSSVGDVPVGGPVSMVSAGQQHTCAVLVGGAVRCWGRAPMTGYGHMNDIGDDETPASAGDVDVGGPAEQVVAGSDHTCAVLEGGALRCWGYNSRGQLGYGHTESIGDNEVPADAGDVDVGGPVRQVALGRYHTCALMESGTVRCWGYNVNGQLGYGNMVTIGDNELPSSVQAVEVGGPVRQVVAGSLHTCVVLMDETVRCWGQGANSQLGYGDLVTIGDDELPTSVGVVDIGGPVRALSAGIYHNCALLATGAVRCWGAGGDGRLGYGNTENIGNDEFPSVAGDVPFL